MCACVRLCVCVCVCVCLRACVRIGAELRCARYRARECNVTLETEITCRRVNKTNSVRLFSLFNKRRYRPLFYWKGNFKWLLLWSGRPPSQDNGRGNTVYINTRCVWQSHAINCTALVPRIAKSTKGGRAFSHLAPKLWNSLPDIVQGSDTLSLFKSRLKTHLFSQAFI